MLREIFIIAAFLFALSGIMAGIVIVQKGASKQIDKVEKVMEIANEIGISQAQVSRLEKNALNHMKKYL